MPMRRTEHTSPRQHQHHAMKIRDIDHVVIRVRDMDLMLRFYRDVLGCPVEKEQPGVGLVQLRAGRSLIDLIAAAADPGAKGRNMDHFCVRIEPWDEAEIRAHLKHHGITAGETRRRYGAEGAGPSIYIDDPEGNTVELKGPPAAAE